MQGHHVALQAPPATGKTTALVLATVGAVVRSVTRQPVTGPAADVRAVIVVPLRELAVRLGTLVNEWIASSGVSDTVQSCLLVSRHVSHAPLRRAIDTTTRHDEFGPVSPGTGSTGGVGNGSDDSTGAGEHDRVGAGGAGAPEGAKPSVEAEGTLPATAVVVASADANVGPGAADTRGAGVEVGTSVGSDVDGDTDKDEGRGASMTAAPGAGSGAAARGCMPKKQPTEALSHWVDIHHCGRAVIVVATPGKLTELQAVPGALANVQVLGVDAADVIMLRRAFVTQTAALLSAVSSGATGNSSDTSRQHRGPALALFTTTLSEHACRGDAHGRGTHAGDVLRHWLYDQFGVVPASRSQASRQCVVLHCGTRMLLDNVHSRRSFFVVPVVGHPEAGAWWEAKLLHVLSWLLRSPPAATTPPAGHKDSDGEDGTSPSNRHRVERGGETPHQIMVFTADGATTDAVAAHVKAMLPGVRVAAIRTRRSVRKDEHARDAPAASGTQMWEQFLSGDLDVLVTSDVGAVGLDTTKVWAVVNVGEVGAGNDAQYVHRAGRCGRQAGSTGCVVTLVDVTSSPDGHTPTASRRSRRRRSRRGGAMVATQGKLETLQSLHDSFTPPRQQSRPHHTHAGYARGAAAVHAGRVPLVQLRGDAGGAWARAPRGADAGSPSSQRSR